MVAPEFQGRGIAVAATAGDRARQAATPESAIALAATQHLAGAGAGLRLATHSRRFGDSRRLVHAARSRGASASGRSSRAPGAPQEARTGVSRQGAASQPWWVRLKPARRCRVGLVFG